MQINRHILNIRTKITINSYKTVTSSVIIPFVVGKLLLHNNAVYHLNWVKKLTSQLHVLTFLEVSQRIFQNCVFLQIARREKNKNRELSGSNFEEEFGSPEKWYSSPQMQFFAFFFFTLYCSYIVKDEVLGIWHVWFTGIWFINNESLLDHQICRLRIDAQMLLEWTCINKLASWNISLYIYYM